MTEPRTVPLAESKLVGYELLPTVIRRQTWGAVEDAADAIRTLTAEVRRLRRRSPCRSTCCGDVDQGHGELAAELDEMRNLLGSISLYVSWRYVTKQLTTEQKELWAKAVDAWSMAMQADDGEDPHPVAERWWWDGFVADRSA